MIKSIWPVALLLANSLAAQPFVLATTQNNGTVEVNIATGEIVQHFAAGNVAVASPQTIYIGDGGGLWEYVIGSESTRSAHIQTSTLPPQGIAITPDFRRVYFVAALRISVFDGATPFDPNATGPRLLTTIPITPGKGRAAMSPDGKRFYSTLGNVIIDTATNAVIGTLPAIASVGIAISPDGSRAYVGNTFDDNSAPGSICNVPDAVTLQVFDTNTRESIRDLKLGGTSCIESLALSPNGRTLYVGDPFSSSIRVVDITTLTQSEPIANVTAQGLVVSADGAQLIAATFKGLVVIDTASQNVIKRIDIGPASSLALLWAPPAPAATLNATTLEASLSPGSMASIYGTDLAHGVQTGGGKQLPTSLLETSVYVNDIPAPLYFVSAEQINFQVPYEASPGPVAVRVERNALRSQNLAATLRDVSPGIFTANQQGTGSGLVFHADSFRRVTPAEPARPGEELSLYAAGLGKLQQNVASGVAPAEAIATLITPQATVGGLTAPVTYSGLAPGYAGVYQVNLQVPTDAQPGDHVALSLSMGDARSNTVEVAIR